MLLRAAGRSDGEDDTHPDEYDDLGPLAELEPAEPAPALASRR